MNRLGAFYDRFILPHPWIVLALFALLLSLTARWACGAGQQLLRKSWCSAAPLPAGGPNEPK